MRTIRIGLSSHILAGMSRRKDHTKKIKKGNGKIMKKIVKLKSYEGNDEIAWKWALPVYLFSVLVTFIFLLFCKWEPGYHPTVFALVMLRIVASPLLAIFPFGILFVVTAEILDFIPWEVATSSTGQKTEQKRIGFTTYVRLYLTDEQRQREKERHDCEMKEAYYHEKDPELLKQKEDEEDKFHSSLFKGVLSLLMPLVMVTLLWGTEKVPWPGFIRTGSLVLAGLGSLLLLYDLGRFVILYVEKKETFGDVSRRAAYAKCFMLACTGVSLLVLPVIIKYTGTDPDTPFPWNEALQNLKTSWFPILGSAIILGNAFYKMKNKRGRS